MNKSPFKRFINALIIASLVMVMANFGHEAKADSVTSLSDNLSRLRINTLADHTVQFVTPSGVDAGETMTLTFDSDFVMGSFSVDNIDLATATTCGGSFTDKTLGSSPSGATWGVGQAGQIITFTSGTDTITSTHCIKIEIGANATSGASGATQITNPTAAQTATLAIGGTFGDTGTAALAIVDTNYDQVSVTATVDPTISFALSDATIGFGTLSASAARYATGDTNGSAVETSAHNLQVATNAPSGYNLYVLGSTLTSGANTITAIGGTAATSSTGTEQFGIYVSASGGSGTASAPYATASNYAYDAATVQDIIGASAGPSTTTTFSVNYLANISATTEAGSYTTTLTYTATGSF